MSACGYNIPTSSDNAVFVSSAEQSISSSITFSKSSRFLISLEDIKFDGTIFRLNAPIAVTLYVEDGIWNCEYEAIPSLSYGATPEQAVHSFFEDFAVLWDEIAKAPDE